MEGRKERKKGGRDERRREAGREMRENQDEPFAPSPSLWAYDALGQWGEVNVGVSPGSLGARGGGAGTLGHSGWGLSSQATVTSGSGCGPATPFGRLLLAPSVDRRMSVHSWRRSVLLGRVPNLGQEKALREAAAMMARAPLSV